MSDLQNIKLKVCGMRDNISQVVALNPDLLGFIFYDKSPRYVGNLPVEVINKIPNKIEKVGVFVNSSEKEVINIAVKYGLQYVQLHGDESVEYCEKLNQEGLRIIKVFGGNKELSAELLSSYAPVIDFYMFDTKTEKYGGTGQKFDWKILKSLHLQKPIFLSGGIDLENIDQLDEISDLNIYAIDVNSKFEVSPGLKNIELLEKLKSKIGESKNSKIEK